MSVTVIIPVKPFAEGKSRLSAFLSDEQRYRLNRNMFLHVLKAVLAAQGIDDILVISRDEEALNLAEEASAHAILENPNSNLNTALDVARKASSSFNATALLILPADLAKLEQTDLRDILTCADSHAPATPLVIIAPDESKRGTNALFIRPPDSINFLFGANSLERHQAMAIDAGCEISILTNPNLSCDIDEPKDLINIDIKFWQS